VRHHKRGSAAGKVADVEASAIALDSMFGEGRESCALGKRPLFDILPLITVWLQVRVLSGPPVPVGNLIRLASEAASRNASAL
jgi:hypothetical protein